MVTSRWLFTFLYITLICARLIWFFKKNKILRQALLLTNCYTTKCQLYSNYELSRNISENFWKIWLNLYFFLKKKYTRWVELQILTYIFLPSQNSRGRLFQVWSLTLNYYRGIRERLLLCSALLLRCYDSKEPAPSTDGWLPDHGSVVHIHFM